MSKYRHRPPAPPKGSNIQHSEPPLASAPFLSTSSLASPLAKLPAEGTLLVDRFEIIKCIGSGGTCTVYKALDHHRLTKDFNDPCVAVKIPHRRYLDDPLWLQAFEQEALHSVRLQHPNIVEAYGYYSDDNNAFIAMEFLHGVALSERIRSSEFAGMPWQDAERIISAMGHALSYAHSQGIVHRDFKPSNVFLTEQGAIKLIDFGISRHLHEETGPDTFSNLGGASPGYASPAVLEGAGPDIRDDVYSLACTAYELLTGRHPFAHQPATQAREAGLQVPRQNLSLRVHDVFKRALAYDPSQRTATVTAFVTELSQAYSSLEPKFEAALIAVAVLALAWLGLKFVSLGYLESRPQHEAMKNAPRQEQPSLPVQARTALPAPPTTVPEIPVSPGSNEAQKLAQIRALIASANMRLDANRYIAPSGGSALDDYRAILQINPAYEPARQGIRELKERFRTAAEIAHRSGNLQAARIDIENALTIDPEDRDLHAFKEQLDLQNKPSSPPAAVRTDTRSVSQPQPTIDPLNRAHQQLHSGHLFFPVQDSAWTLFTHVLDTDPNNAAALTGLRLVMARLIEKARHLHANGATERSQALVEQALRLVPGDAELTRLRAELQTAPTTKGRTPINAKTPAPATVVPDAAGTSVTQPADHAGLSPKVSPVAESPKTADMSSTVQIPSAEPPPSDIPQPTKRLRHSSTF